jgi:hypothetical protein
MRKRVNHYKFTLLVAAIAILPITIAVYALASGSFNISGSVRRSVHCKLNIEAAANVNTGSTTLYQNDSTIFATVDVAARETLSFSTNLVYGAPAKEVTFQIQNVGVCSQQLGSLMVTRAPANGVVVNWPDLDGIILLPGESTGTKTITVEWISEPTSTTDEIMQAMINYIEYTP